MRTLRRPTTFPRSTPWSPVSPLPLHGEAQSREMAGAAPRTPQLGRQSWSRSSLGCSTAWPLTRATGHPRLILSRPTHPIMPPHPLPASPAAETSPHAISMSEMLSHMDTPVAYASRVIERPQRPDVRTTLAMVRSSQRPQKAAAPRRRSARPELHYDLQRSLTEPQACIRCRPGPGGPATGMCSSLRCSPDTLTASSHPGSQAGLCCSPGPHGAAARGRHA